MGEEAKRRKSKRKATFNKLRKRIVDSLKRQAGSSKKRKSKLKESDKQKFREPMASGSKDLLIPPEQVTSETMTAFKVEEIERKRQLKEDKKREKEEDRKRKRNEKKNERDIK